MADNFYKVGECPMLNMFEKKLKTFHKKIIHISLKKRILSFFFTLIFSAFLGFASLSGWTIFQLIENRIATNYGNNLDQTCSSIENIIWNLNLVSQQLAYENEIQVSLSEYITCQDKIQRNILYHSLRQKILLTTFSNADIGLFYYYDPKNKELFLNNLPLTQYVTLSEQANILMRQNDIVYYGPFTSQTRFNGNLVLALNRKFTTLDGTVLNLCVESGYSSLKQIFKFNSAMNSYLLFLDNNYNIVFSDIPENLSIHVDAFKSGSISGHTESYHWFKKQTKQHWTVVSVIPSVVYEKEIRVWLFQIILIAFLFLSMAALLGRLLWSMIYKPLKMFDLQLDQLLTKNETLELSRTNIPEYDYLLDRLKSMKFQIKSMIEQIIVQEKQYANIEIEKLRYQINPHFLMNTLNILHWMAVMNEQKDIDDITQSLNRLLSYNLDKKGPAADLEQELGAAAEYIALQQVRYDFNYSVIREPAHIVMDYPCPKFILQPLLENAIYHGYLEGMSLTLRITVTDKIKIEIVDTGLGMSPNVLAKLKEIYQNPNNDNNYLDNIPQQHRYGIGLQYVFQSLKDFYQASFEFDINSVQNKGTTLTLILPKVKGGGYID